MLEENGLGYYVVPSVKVSALLSLYTLHTYWKNTVGLSNSLIFIIDYFDNHVGHSWSNLSVQSKMQNKHSDSVAILRRKRREKMSTVSFLTLQGIPHPSRFSCLGMPRPFFHLSSSRRHHSNSVSVQCCEPSRSFSPFALLTVVIMLVKISRLHSNIDQSMGRIF